jgi:uncharacterized membrane protein YeiB
MTQTAAPKHDPAPVPGNSRLQQLDGLRGVALLGILLVNILYWSGWGLMTKAQQVAHSGAQLREMQWFFDHLLPTASSTRCSRCCSGIGCALQLQRLQAGGHDGVRVYLRRMAVLLVIGLLHSLLVWDGDILQLAICVAPGRCCVKDSGLRRPDRALLLWAVRCWCGCCRLRSEALFEARGWNQAAR